MSATPPTHPQTLPSWIIKANPSCFIWGGWLFDHTVGGGRRGITLLKIEYVILQDICIHVWHNIYGLFQFFFCTNLGIPLKSINNVSMKNKWSFSKHFVKMSVSIILKWLDLNWMLGCKSKTYMYQMTIGIQSHCKGNFDCSTFYKEKFLKIALFPEIQTVLLSIFWLS